MELVISLGAGFPLVKAWKGVSVVAKGVKGFA